MSRRKLTTIIGGMSVVLVALQTYLAGELEKDDPVQGLILLVIGGAAISIATLGAYLKGID